MKDQLYSDGNGRMVCSKLACAGGAMFYSKFKTDLHGAKVIKVTAKFVADMKATMAHYGKFGWVPKCESCGTLSNHS
jgi:hypothetical protein